MKYKILSMDDEKIFIQHKDQVTEWVYGVYPDHQTSSDLVVADVDSCFRATHVETAHIEKFLRHYLPKHLPDLQTHRFIRAYFNTDRNIHIYIDAIIEK